MLKGETYTLKRALRDVFSQSSSQLLKLELPSLHRVDLGLGVHISAPILLVEQGISYGLWNDIYVTRTEALLTKPYISIQVDSALDGTMAVWK